MRLIALYDNEEVSESHSPGVASAGRGSMFFALPQPSLTGDRSQALARQGEVCLPPVEHCPRRSGKHWCGWKHSAGFGKTPVT